VLISRAVKTYCGDDNGRSSKNRTQRKNTAADGCDDARVKCVLFVYVCIFCIFGEDLLGYSYRWYV
jgi:hypothetical protein